MKKNEVANIGDTINESQVPSIIQEQFNKLSVLRKNIDKATKKAELAQESAESARNNSAGLFHRKAAIESLQEATSDLADAQISATQAQEVSFEYQQKLGEITKYLFGIGVTNMALNRSVVQELEMRLQGASEKEIDEFARQEIIGVVKQLKAQEDIMKKQSDLAERVKEHEHMLASYEKKDMEYVRKFEKYEEHEKEQDALLQKYAENDRNQDEEIVRQAARDEELEDRIDEGEEKDKSQDEEIARQAAQNEELGKLINELVQSNLEKEIQITELKSICDKLSLKIELGSERMDNTENKLLARIDEKAGKKENIVSCVIGIVALLVSIIQFIISL